MLIVAVVSGIALLVWYVPSAEEAYASVSTLGAFHLGTIVRGVHRYSSDACVLFAVLHGLRCLVGSRLFGARWLAWMSGLLSLAGIWLTGWLGYWLVWDESGELVARLTAKTLDVLPIFAEPMSLSFITDKGLPSFLFFVVFFVHMLLPLPLAIGLWVHITRLSRPGFLPTRALMIASTALILAVPLLVPVQSAEPAAMLRNPSSILADAWYLWPALLLERATPAVAWAVALGSGCFLLSLPWVLGRRTQRNRPTVAEVDLKKCNACQNCFNDCPYGAIEWGARSDGRPHNGEPVINPAKCVGCGICAGSCDSAAIGVEWLSPEAVRKALDVYLDRTGAGARLAFVCAHSQGASITIDSTTGTSEALPGWVVWPVPCLGWIHALTIERAFRHGASEVVLLGCASSGCEFREGMKWAKQRILGLREPELRIDKLSGGTVRFALTLKELTDLPATTSSALPGSRHRLRQVSTGALAAVLMGVATVAPSRVQLPLANHLPTITLGFRHPGRVSENCHTRTPAELAKLPPHMRQPKICERSRASVRAMISVDGVSVYDKRHVAGGLFSDRASIGLITIHPAAGQHLVSVEIADGTEKFVDSRTISVSKARGIAIEFDRAYGFRWTL